MRICIIGDNIEKIDEGMKNVAYYIYHELSKNHDVLYLPVNSVFTLDFWRKLKNFKPHIVHYVSGPSIFSFLITKIIKIYLNNTPKTVISALHPTEFSYFSKKLLLPAIKPDIVIVYSYDRENLFRELGMMVKFLPLGVDINRFYPVSKDTKQKLRKKYGISKNKFIILHVGHIKEGRNVRLLSLLQRENNQVLIIGSTSTKAEIDLYNYLRKKECTIWRQYFKNIEEIYQLADCYVFPTVDRLNSIDIPLSILEAMGCNLPVITTKFGGLPRLFLEGHGIIFIESLEEILEGVTKIKNLEIKTYSRKIVEKYSWNRVIKKIEEIYTSLLSKKGC